MPLILVLWWSSFSRLTILYRTVPVTKMSQVHNGFLLISSYFVIYTPAKPDSGITVLELRPDSTLYRLIYIRNSVPNWAAAGDSSGETLERNRGNGVYSIGYLYSVCMSRNGR